jgi:dTDP-4-dehydrorhamnose 3,5-epimerase
MRKRIEAVETKLPGLFSLVRHPVGDNRGYFERMFCDDELAPLLAGRSIAQINRTLTAQPGTVRGMHFQHPPYAETKIVSCLRGSIFDVAVDLRKDSPTFLQWHGAILSTDNHASLYIPEGFAHGFQALTDNCELLYFHTSRFEGSAEGGVDATDPRIGITWPQPIAARSPRDSSHPMLSSDFEGISA